MKRRGIVVPRLRVTAIIGHDAERIRFLRPMLTPFPTMGRETKLVGYVLHPR